MKYQNPKRGKQNAVLNFFTLVAVIIGLSIWFTAESLWQPGTIAVIALLSLPTAFYFWLWRKYFS